MLACLVYVCAGLRGNYCVCMCACLVEQPLRHRVLCGLHYVIYTKEANGYCIRYLERGSRDRQTITQAGDDVHV